MHKKTVLENGLRVITETMSHLNSVTIGIWANIGSRNEAREANGLSHFIEHMLFKGTKTRSALEIAAALESLGGNLNAFTGRENTCYYARTLDTHLPLAAEILCDLLSNPTFENQHLRMEKKVILEEIKDSLDTPSDYVHDLFAKSTWRRHPLGYPILGSAANIKRIQREKVLSYFKKSYVTSNTVVAAAGNVNHAKLVRQIREQLKIKTHKRKVDQKLEKPACFPARKICFRDINQAHIVLGWETIAFDNPDRYPLLILNNILGGGMSSRFFQRIREEMGLAYTVFSYQDYYRDTGISGAYMGCDQSKTVEAVNLLMAEVEKIKNDDISEAEFSSSKMQLIGNLMLGLESSTNRMNRLARNELYLNRFISLKETVKNIEKIKKADLTEVATKYLDPEKASLVILGPVDKSKISQMNL